MGSEIIRKVSTHTTPKLWFIGDEAQSHPSSYETFHMWKQCIFVHIKRQIMLGAVAGTQLHCF